MLMLVDDNNNGSDDGDEDADVEEAVAPWP